MPESGGLRISTNKPLTCLMCGKRFESKEILNAHKVREHDFKVLLPSHFYHKLAPRDAAKANRNITKTVFTSQCRNQNSGIH
jgi:hypothetical protein